MVTLGGFERLPVAVARVEWTPKQVRTRIPPAPAHDEWHLAIDLHCQAGDIRSALIVVDGPMLRYDRGRNDLRTQWVSHRVSFSPRDWDASDEVGVLAGGELRTWITSPELKVAPDRTVETLVGVGDALATGTVVDLFRIRGTRLLWQVALLARSDTRSDRTRWRVTPAIDRDGTYGFLATGRRSGYHRTDDRALERASDTP